jgi:hypothetical protein
MHPLAKRIALVVSAFSLMIGLFLLGANLRIIPGDAMAMALNLWPILLVLVGILLLFDSTKKRMRANGSQATTTHHPLPFREGAAELAVKLQFSYGRLVVTRAAGAPQLTAETMGPIEAPTIINESMGERSGLTIAMSQPLFPSHVMYMNSWRLELPPRVPLRLSLQLHGADLRLDLRGLSVESIDLRTESGTQELLLGRPLHKTTGSIYASGSSVSVVLPARVFSWVRLLNPFCRVDYPQGDMEKRQDGSLITPSTPDAHGSVELDVDGPIRNLIVDIEDAAET